MSEAVERRIVAMLDKPLVCPHGNPIPGLDELGLPFATVDDHAELISLRAATAEGPTTVTVDRLSEQIQPDAALMRMLYSAGVRPGRTVSVSADDDGVEVLHGDSRTTLDRHVSDHVFVRRSSVGQAT